MISRDDTCFGYRIRATDTGWDWMAFDLAGKVQERGHAPDKAIAAACVIRALARAASSDSATVRRAA
ncbi:MAG: hypothetical protein JWQ52_1393 [Phenylobacterium sp.]|jgi:hypothetical protein|nr:hypothetical protein [Phenylobacterium sp.]